MRIGVTISRDWDDWATVLDAICEVTQGISYNKVTLIHGASQTDFFIAGVAYMLGMDLEPHPADWKRLPRAAGHIRNKEMVDSGADVWLAFIKNSSGGASGCAELAEQAGILTHRYPA